MIPMLAYIIGAILIALSGAGTILSLARYRFKGDAIPHFIWFYVIFFLADVIITLFIIAPAPGVSP